MTEDQMDEMVAGWRDLPATQLTFLAEKLGHFLRGLMDHEHPLVREGAVLAVDLPAGYLDELAVSDPSPGVRKQARATLADIPRPATPTP